MSLRFINRYRPQHRQSVQALIDCGAIEQSDELALLDDKQLHTLALLSFWLLISGALFFSGFDVLSYYRVQQHFISSLSWIGIILWIIGNIVSYILVLLVHELIHAIAIFFWGGHPHFGARLPLALFCGARNQGFYRNHYLVIALAPFVLLTPGYLLLAWFFPGLASYLLLAVIGNFSGAAGDLLVAHRLWRLSATDIIEDTETGYRAWTIVPSH